MQTIFHRGCFCALPLEDLLGLYLFVRVDVDVALDALLSHVGPRVAAHPLPFTLGALVLSEASLLPLVGREALALRPGLKGTRPLGVTCVYICKTRSHITAEMKVQSQRTPTRRVSRGENVFDRHNDFPIRPGIGAACNSCGEHSCARDFHRSCVKLSR